MTAEDSTRMLADTSELIIGAKDVPDSFSAAGHDLFYEMMERTRLVSSRLDNSAKQRQRRKAPFEKW